MWWWCVLGAVAGAGVWARRRARAGFWHARGVPHRPPLPLLGSLDCFFNKNFGLWMRDLHTKFSAPFVGIWVFLQPVLVVGDPDVARRILTTDNDVFRNRFLASGTSDPVGGLNIFTVDDPMWSTVRRRLTYVFTAAKLKAMHEYLTIKAKAMVDRIKRDKANNNYMELRSLFADFSTDVIGSFAFGLEANAVDTGDSPVRAVTREFMKFNWFRGLSWYSIFFWPWLVDIFGFSFFPKDVVEFFRKTINKIIEQRSANQIKNNDLLGALVKMKEEGLDGETECSDDLLAAQAAIMLQAGFDTTAVSLAFLVYELAHNTNIQEKLYKELIEAKTEIGDVDFNFNHLENLTYLNCVIKETQRRYPPMGWLDRVSTVDYKITDILTLPAGTPVYVNVIGMQHDPRYFPDPYNFNPDRFLPKNQPDIVPYSYLPFGDGPRMCIGKRFAQMTIRYLLSELVLRLQFRQLPGRPKPSEVVMETKGLFLNPETSLTVEFVARN